jgi:hypothetical protein
MRRGPRVIGRAVSSRARGPFRCRRPRSCGREGAVRFCPLLPSHLSHPAARSRSVSLTPIEEASGCRSPSLLRGTRNGHALARDHRQRQCRKLGKSCRPMRGAWRCLRGPARYSCMIRASLRGTYRRPRYFSAEERLGRPRSTLATNGRPMSLAGFRGVRTAADLSRSLSGISHGGASGQRRRRACADRRCRYTIAPWRW